MLPEVCYPTGASDRRPCWHVEVRLACCLAWLTDCLTAFRVVVFILLNSPQLSSVGGRCSVFRRWVLAGHVRPFNSSPTAAAASARHPFVRSLGWRWSRGGRKLNEEGEEEKWSGGERSEVKEGE